MSEHDHHGSRLDGGHIATEDHHHGMTRRAAIGAAGAGGLALLFTGIRGSVGGRALDALGPDIAEAASASCIMTPAKTVGPYFVDEKLNRSDVRPNTSHGAVQAGVPLTLRMQIFDADNSCAPVQGATVDIWHANASGLYSDEAANNTSGQNWLRGYQTTDADGLVTFTTIYPGWYSGRAVHIHFKVRIYDGSTETLEFTSQMFFTDAMNASVFTSYSPYKDRTPQTPDTTDASDNILGSDAATLTLSPVSDGNGGYTADFSVGVSQTTSQLNNNSGGGPGGPGGAPPGQPPTTTTTGNGTTTTTDPTTGSSTTTTSTADKTVAAALKSATMLRTALGTRQLRLRIKTQEAVTLTAKLVRGNKVLASKKVQLATGTTNVKLRIPASASAGAAKLKLTLKDSAGNTKSYARTVHVHALK
jgi:protocatechuate 3,4-dioxygenase beta subunit